MQHSVYFIRSCDHVGLIKIGFASDPIVRLVQLQTGAPFPLKLMGTIRFESLHQARDFEGRCHRTFTFCRRSGEWFSACTPLREFIALSCTGGDPYKALLVAFNATKGKVRKAKIRESIMAKRA